MFTSLGFAAETRANQNRQQQEAAANAMNRNILGAATNQAYHIENPFTRRGSLGNGLHLGSGKKRPKIEFVLDDQPADFRIPSYTTRERIVGHVEITAGTDIPFDDLHVSLQGTSRTWVEKIVTTAPTNPRTRAFHTFLRLLQPIEESEIPESHILRAGRTYKIPFEFVVPERLLPQTCSHPRDNSHVEQEHLKLPASLGDAMVSGDGKTLSGDHSPESTTITYSLRCILTKKPATGSSRRPVLIGDEQKKLRIIPKVEELPPLVITDEPGDDYCIHRTKNIKKGILMGKTKIGSLDVRAKQPAALRLPGVRAAADPSSIEPVMTMVNLKLRFDPAKNAFKPPKLQMIWTRLKIGTFFATVPQKSIPSKSAAFGADINKGLMVETMPLSALNLGGVSWIKHSVDRRDSGFALTGRRDSAEANSSPDESPFVTPVRSPTPSPATTPMLEDGPGYIYYTADVTIPIELPSGKHAFVPTFHSCLISRIYALDISLNTSTGAANSTNVHLKIPVQVTSTGSKNPVPLDGMIPEGGFESARAESRDMYAPNMVNADNDEEAPPDFDDLSIHEVGGAAVAAAAAAAEEPEVGSDGEYNLRRPRWTAPSAMAARDPAQLAAELDQHHLHDDAGSTRSPGARSPVSGTPVMRSPMASLGSSPTRHFRVPQGLASGARPPGVSSPPTRSASLTNDQILNTEEYDLEEGSGNTGQEAQFGSFRFEPQNFGRPGEGSNRGEASNGEWRRASEVLPPGYASVAAGTMLMGSGGMVRALS